MDGLSSNLGEQKRQEGKKLRRQNGNDDFFVIVRWFERVEAHGFNPITHIPSFKLEQGNRTDSYCVLPAFSILNGAVMVPGMDNRYWALLSPKEEKIYAYQFQ